MDRPCRGRPRQGHTAPSQNEFPDLRLQYQRSQEMALLEASSVDRPIVLDAYTAMLLIDFGVMAAIKARFSHVLLPSSALNEFRAQVEEATQQRDEPALSLSFEDGHIIRTERSPGDTAATLSSLNDLITQLESAVQIVGTEMPDEGRVRLGNLADHFGPQFDTLSVALREGGIVMSADLRLRTLAHVGPGIDACGLDPMMRLLGEADLIGWDMRAEIALKALALGHSNVAISARILMEILTSDAHTHDHAFAIAANTIGAPGADARSHILAANSFVHAAFETLPALKAQRASSIVLRALVRLKGINPWVVLDAMVARAARADVIDYYAAWGRGNLLGVVR